MDLPIRNKIKMYWLFLKYGFLAILTYLVIREVKIYLGILRLARSVKSEVMYFPFIGFLFHYLTSKKNKDTSNWIKKRVNKAAKEGKKIIITNFTITDKPLIIALDPKLIGDIYAKELEYIPRKDLQPDGLKLMNFGLFYDNSKKALAMRGAFTDIFKDENMNKIAPSIEKIVERRYKEIIEDHQDQLKEKGYIDVDLKPVFLKFFNFFLENF